MVNAADKIYGPYIRKDGRQIIIINGKTISYPKYLYEKHHNTKIEEPYTIDHIDGNFRNNDINNLQVISRKTNASFGVLRVMYEHICARCKQKFTRQTKLRNPNWNAYCSTFCRDAAK